MVCGWCACWLCLRVCACFGVGYECALFDGGNGGVGVRVRWRVSSKSFETVCSVVSRKIFIV